jgi:translation initiation factor 5A
VPCRIVSIEHSKAGKHGGAKFRIEGIGLFDGIRKSIIKPSGQNVEVPIIDKRTAQVLTVIGDNVQLMDMTSFETFELPMPEEPEIKSIIAEGVEVAYMEVMGKRKILQAKGKGD